MIDLESLTIEIQDDPTVTIQNIVSSGDLGATLNLNVIAIGLGLEDVEYEPEQFPGLVYRLDNPDVVILLFGSGKPSSPARKTPLMPNKGWQLFVMRSSRLDCLSKPIQYLIPCFWVSVSQSHSV